MKLLLRLFITFCALFSTELFAGNLLVNLAPAAAVTAGAQWRVDGGSWKSSGVTVSNLTNANHTVSFKAVTGWTAPAAATVTITSGTTTYNATYVQLASLQINLNPTNGKWRIDAGTWRTSGTLVANLTPGVHTIDYLAVTGYSTPAAENITLVSGQTTTFTRNYVALAGLTLTLAPTTAQWRVDGGAWKASGVTVANLTPGMHTVDYNILSGYAAPASESVTLISGQTLALTRSYVQLAKLKITLSPSAVGAWQVDGIGWQTSGVTVSNLPAGIHTINYATVPGYIAPSSETVTLGVGQTLNLSRNYILSSTLSVTLQPDSGQWQVDGGTWLASGSSAILTPGSHAIAYSALTGYTSPANEVISLIGGQTIGILRPYSPQAKITIGLVPADGQWRANGGAWQASTSSRFVNPGNYLIEYSVLPLYDSPPSENISLVGAGVFTATRSYTSQKPSVQINLNPSTGQWRVDGGTWQASGALITELSVGAHTVDYTDIGGTYNPLPSETITLTLRENGVLARSYPIKPPASLTVTLDPATAQWRVDAGAWQSSGATLNDLAYDIVHTIDYALASGYITPASETITPTSGQLVTLSRNYTQLASFYVNLTPSSAQWRIDGGSWNLSGPATILNNLALGTHTVEFSDVIGYITPPAETVNLVSGSNAPLERSYTPLASFYVNLTPSSAQWRIDGGAWTLSGPASILNDLSLGVHTVEFSDVQGYITPSSETITLVSGPNAPLERTYTPLASLYVNLGQAPSLAQWRIDGGTWNSGATILNNLSLGVHLIEYSAVIGYITPPSETITLVSGPNSATTPTYIPLASLYVNLGQAPSLAQWRIDGGTWNSGATILNNLSLGQHLIEYSDVIGYITPPSETITLVSGPNNATTPIYIPLASLYVDLSQAPLSAQWRVDGGTWNLGATILNNLSLGVHTIQYSDVVGYITPLADTFTLVSGANNPPPPFYTPQEILGYRVTPIPVPSGRTGAVGYSINDAGVIAGLTTNTSYLAFKYRGGTTQLLGTLGGTDSMARGINNAGTVVGESYISGNLAWHAFSYDNGVMQDLGTLGGNSSYACGINDAGTIVGYSNLTNNGPARAFIYSNGVMQDLGTLGSTNNTEAYDINNAGTVVGSSYTAGNVRHAFSYSNGVMQDLGTLGVNMSEAVAINDAGTIAGDFHTTIGTSSTHAFIYENGVMKDLGALGGSTSRSSGINDAGKVVGFSFTASSQSAFIYENGAMKDLNDFINVHNLKLPWSEGINNLGQIVASDGAQCYLLTPDATLGYLRVDMQPSSGQWRIDGGTWRTSGTTAYAFDPGSHSIEYSNLSGFSTPPAETVTFVSGANPTLTRTYTPVPLASFSVILNPSSAPWRIDGGAWTPSGTTLTGLALGTHTIEYGPVAGYATPPFDLFDLVSGVNGPITRNYTPNSAFASIGVTLTPSSAQWRIDGGAWKPSGLIVSNLTLGAHSIDYSSVGGFATPQSETVILFTGSNPQLVRSYTTTALAANIGVSLTPSSALWRIDGGAWRATNTTLGNLALGTHFLEYSLVAGYATPQSETISLISGTNPSLTRNYTPTSLAAIIGITLNPLTAQWQIDNGAWLASSAVVSNLALGTHTISYSPVAGFATPLPETISLFSGPNPPLTRNYTANPLAAAIGITLIPASALWRIDGGAWMASDSSVSNLALGSHTISYSPVAGYATPLPETISLFSGPNPPLTRSYTATPLAAAFRINLNPTSAQWRIDGGAWTASSASIGNLALGAHTIDYAPVVGYATPQSETVMLVSGTNPPLNRTYTTTALAARVAVTLTPSSAQWRIDGGAWQSSGTMISNLSLGTHTISYATVVGFATQQSETVTLASGINPPITRSYTPNSAAATIGVTLYPTDAQWRIDGGAWMDSGFVAGHLALGTHTISYSAIADFVTPPTETVILVSGSNPPLTRYYYPGSLTSLFSVTLNPSTAQWRLDGGAWNDSGAILDQLTLGSHTVEYSTLVGYITPPSETVIIVSGPNGPLDRTYTPLASLYVNLTTPGAQWRIDGGAWNFGATILYSLSLGTHLIEYSDVIGYITPTSEAITLLSGPNSHNAPSYTQLASLNVSLTTSGAQWRIDGGAWSFGATILYNLSLGTHLIEYSDVIGYITPTSEAITLLSGPNSHNAPSYTQLASLNVSLTTSGAQWRIDGGAWNFGATILYNLSLGTHLIEYSDVIGYSTPASETVTLVSGPNSHNAPSYTQDAAISVYLDLGYAQWRLDGGEWNPSGSYRNNLSIGTHTIEYSQHEGYTSPPSESVALLGGYNPSLSRSYTAIPTFYADPALATLSISLQPTFAEWRLDGGNWNTSGAFLHNLSLGTHSVEYSTVGGYITPPADIATLHDGYNSYATSYTELAILNVYIEPAQGQWRVDGGAWYDRNAVVGSLTLGAHTIEYAPVAGYATPPAESVTLTSGLNPSLFRSYASLTPAQITITTNPASGQWRIYPQQSSPTGEWKSSGATVTSLNPGSYSVEYASVAGYTLPGSTSVELLPNDHQTISATYAPIPAQLKIILFPHSGKYRINGGAWNLSGSTTMGAAPGNYLIEFQDLAGYPTPAPTTITLNPGDVKEFVYGYGPLPPPTLTFNLTPNTGLWRVDGGSWNASGTTVTDLTVGSHSVEFSPLSGYLTPATTSVQLTEAEEKILSKTYYVGSASLRVYLNPSNGRWRMDGGNWILSSWTIYFGSGPHLIEYEPLPGLIAPLSENLFLEVNENRVITRNYQ